MTMYYLCTMTYKKCNDKDCPSKGILLPEEDFAMRSGSVYRMGTCRTCASRKAKAKRAEKAREREKLRPVKKKLSAKDETDLFNSINRRW